MNIFFFKIIYFLLKKVINIFIFGKYSFNYYFFDYLKIIYITQNYKTVLISTHNFIIKSLHFLIDSPNVSSMQQNIDIRKNYPKFTQLSSNIINKYIFHSFSGDDVLFQIRKNKYALMNNGR